MLNQLSAIRCFARVVETTSFTRAAESLGIPKATVSKLIQDLEEYLGVMLLQRSTRRVTVTADGFTYYEGTARFLRELSDFDQDFAGSRISPSGKIRVDIGGTPGRMILLPALPDFFARFPDIQIELGVGDRSVDMIEESVDCAIRGGPMLQESLVARLLGTASWTTCATPDYLDKFGVPQHPTDLLTGHRIIGYHASVTGKPIPSRFEKGSESFDILGPTSISVNDGSARAIAGLGGMGVLQTFTYAIKPQLADGSLLPILEDWAPARYPFHVVYPPNRRLSNRVRVFIAWLSEVFGSLD